MKGTTEQIGNQEGGFLGNVLRPLMKVGLLLMENVLTALAKSVLLTLGLTATSSAADARIHRKILNLEATILAVSNEEMEDATKIVKSLDKSGLLIKGASETIRC